MSIFFFPDIDQVALVTIQPYVYSQLCKMKLVFTLLVLLTVSEGYIQKPNIVIIVADDMGFNDVSFHGSNQIPTPNIDALAYNGIILNRHYVLPMCTPSRAALMTGKYPIHIGMQHFVIPSDEPWGLGLDEKIMPEYFKELGYKTHLVGKWHLGFHQKDYTPTYRGFDEHIGYWGPYIDYWDHSLLMPGRNYSQGHDFRRNMTVDRTSRGIYATELFTEASESIIQNHNTETGPLFLLINHLAPHTANHIDPLQAPEEEISKFHTIKDLERRTLAAMISLMDKSVGQVVTVLKKRKMLNNTIILFYSDNGAPSIGLHANKGSNYPFKGQKNTPFEGAVRVPAFIWGHLFENTQRVSNQLISNVDWLPTLLEIVTGNTHLHGLDGVSQWKSLKSGSPGPRTELLINIDDETGYAALIRDGWKLVDETLARSKMNGEFLEGREWLGNIDKNDGHMTSKQYLAEVINSNAGQALATSIHKSIVILREAAKIDCGTFTPYRNCVSTHTPCLFNLKKDPCEHNNVAEEQPDRVKALEHRLAQYRSGMVPSRKKPSDPNSNPVFYNYTWTFWKS